MQSCLIKYFRFIDTIEGMLLKDIEDNNRIGKAGSKAILALAQGEDSMVRILTHCNTGSLATAGYGTALGIIRSLQSRNKLGMIKFIFHNFLSLHNFISNEFSSSAKQNYIILCTLTFSMRNSTIFSRIVIFKTKFNYN